MNKNTDKEILGYCPCCNGEYGYVLDDTGTPVTEYSLCICEEEPERVKDDDGAHFFSSDLEFDIRMMTEDELTDIFGDFDEEEFFRNGVQYEKM